MLSLLSGCSLADMRFQDAQYKSSLAVMKRFASTYLVAEGGIKRYLGHLGITLHHVQHPLDDCDFRLTNMAKDFCDGTRLCQLVSLLSETDIMPVSLRNDLEIQKKC